MTPPADAETVSISGEPSESAVAIAAVERLVSRLAQHQQTVIALLAEIAALKKQVSVSSSQTWQPIESAPRDGTRILVWDSYDDETVVFWSADSKDWLLNVAGSYAEDRDHTFTHWMPLPAPPASEPPQVK